MSIQTRISLSDSLQLGNFTTLEECGIRSIAILGRLGALRNGDYECGKNCKRDERSTFYVCTETAKAKINIEMDSSYLGASILDVMGNACIKTIATIYQPEYLTYLGRLKAWYARKASSLGVPISAELDQFANTYAKFSRAVNYLSYTSDDIIPTLEMSPVGFEVYFNAMTKPIG